MRFPLTMILYLSVPSVAHVDDHSNESAAIKRFELLGSNVTRDMILPGSRVVGVVLEGSTTFNDSLLHMLESFKNLATLKLNQTPVRGTGLKELADLETSDNVAITDACVKEIVKLKKLEVITLCGTQVADAGIAEIR